MLRRMACPCAQKATNLHEEILPRQTEQANASRKELIKFRVGVSFVNSDKAQELKQHATLKSQVHAVAFVSFLRFGLQSSSSFSWSSVGLLSADMSCVRHAN